MNDDLSQAAIALGRAGGLAGTGKVKRRGGASYYKRIRAMRKTYPKRVNVKLSSSDKPA